MSSKWQKGVLNRAFDPKAKNQDLSDAVLNDLALLNSKNPYIPDSLFKFFRATSENILDLKNRRLWLSHPSSFNDPYDCKIGYNETEYEKLQLLDKIKAQGLIGDSGENVITQYEYEKISDSYVNGDKHLLSLPKEEFDSAVYKILNNKSEDFFHQILMMEADIRSDAKQKINNISQTNIRVACFSAIKLHDIYFSPHNNHECLSKIQMWSHYADNHKGYCVEYDISSFKKDLTTVYSILHFCSETERDKYLDERLRIIIKGGLFPIIYTSNRVKIPYTLLKNYRPDEQEKIVRILYNAYITKSSVWSYENEWRLIIGGKISNYYNNKIPFPYVKTIYLGCMMEHEKIDEMLSVADEIGAEIQIMEMENNKFDLFTSSAEILYDSDKIRKFYNNPFSKK